MLFHPLPLRERAGERGARLDQSPCLRGRSGLITPHPTLSRKGRGVRNNCGAARYYDYIGFWPYGFLGGSAVAAFLALAACFACGPGPAAPAPGFIQGSSPRLRNPSPFRSSRLNLAGPPWNSCRSSLPSPFLSRFLNRLSRWSGVSAAL